MAAAYRVVTGIDFDAVGSGSGVRVEPGDALPPVSEDTLTLLLAIGAVEPADAPPADAPAAVEPPAPDAPAAAEPASKGLD